MNKIFVDKKISIAPTYRVSKTYTHNCYTCINNDGKNFCTKYEYISVGSLHICDSWQGKENFRVYEERKSTHDE